MYPCLAHFNLVQLYAKRYEAGKDNTQDGIPYREKADGRRAGT